ncbi:MAG: hypothetical protein IH840_10180 [Candidatus Heimdallarchaeota archaeon]|nr:hypothetical protein [Candidatus Heimdallarchaeota archaeon]
MSKRVTKKKIVKKKTPDVKSQALYDGSLTNEAEKLFNTYIAELTTSYENIGMTIDEINESIEEVKDHMISLAKFYHGKSGLIPTDVVKKAISKLGEPEIIQRAFTEEIKLQEVLTEKLLRSEVPFKTGEGEINAKAAASAYSVSFYLTIGSLIFMLFGYTVSIYISGSSYVFMALIRYTTRTRVNFERNLMLNDRMGNLFLLLVHPLIYIMLQAVVFTLELNENGNIFNPIVIFVWFLILTQKETREYLQHVLKMFAERPKRPHEPETSRST